MMPARWIPRVRAIPVETIRGPICVTCFRPEKSCSPPWPLVIICSVTLTSWGRSGRLSCWGNSASTLIPSASSMPPANKIRGRYKIVGRAIFFLQHLGAAQPRDKGCAISAAVLAGQPDQLNRALRALHPDRSCFLFSSLHADAAAEEAAAADVERTEERRPGRDLRRNRGHHYGRRI